MGKKYDCSHVKEGGGLMITVNKGVKWLENLHTDIL